MHLAAPEPAWTAQNRPISWRATAPSTRDQRSHRTIHPRARTMP